EETFLFLGRERAADGSPTSFGEHLHVVLEPTPLFEAPENLTQCSNIHVDRPIAGAFKATLSLKPLDDLSSDGRKLHIAQMPLHDLQPLAIEFDRALRVCGRLLPLQ